MKRRAVLWVLLLAGCSTAPVADVLDFFKPGRLGPEQVAPYGGVCNPRPGGILAPGSPAALAPPLLPGPAGPGPAPPPAPPPGASPPAIPPPAPPPSAPPVSTPAPGIAPAVDSGIPR